MYHFGPLLMGAQTFTLAIDIYLHYQATIIWLFGCTVILFNGGLVRAHKIIQNGLPHICICICMHIYIYICRYACICTFTNNFYKYVHLQTIYIQYLVPPVHLRNLKPLSTYSHHQITPVLGRFSFWRKHELSQGKRRHFSGTTVSCTCQKS